MHDNVNTIISPLINHHPAIQHLVSDHLHQRWRITHARDMAEFACHPSAVLTGELEETRQSYTVFAKFSDSPDGHHQFTVELAGLQNLHQLAGVLIPELVGILPVSPRGSQPGGNILVMQAVQELPRGPLQWQQIGQTLARIHRVKGDSFGFETNGYFGPLPQDNMTMCDWPAFYATRRLIPGLRMAANSGHLPTRLARRVEKLILRLPELCGPEVTPTLLHGDAQQNNYLTSTEGAYVIDPAVYYGHPEMDLAYIDYFQPVPPDVLDAYQQELPIDPGFWERRSLWRIWGYLAAVTVEGSAYLPRLESALKEYL